MHCCDGHRTQEEVSDKPQSLRREGVFSQFTEAFKTNLATLEKGLQIRFSKRNQKEVLSQPTVAKPLVVLRLMSDAVAFVMKNIVLYLCSLFPLLVKGLD